MRLFAELLGSGFGRTGRGVSEKHREGVAEGNRSDEAGTAGPASQDQDADKARSEGENEEKCVGKAGEVGEELEDLLHGGCSLFLSCVALVGLAVSGLVYREHTSLGQVYGGMGVYLGLAALGYAFAQWDFRKGRALLPVDGFGGGRVALLSVVLVLCCFRIEGMEALAGLVALAALMVGGLSDGAWVALVAARRGLGFFAALRQVFVRSEDAQKWFWRALFGEGRR